ncbi:hypothetical protein HK097_003091, partial [Rhizophlyctis rosea]
MATNLNIPQPGAVMTGMGVMGLEGDSTAGVKQADGGSARTSPKSGSSGRLQRIRSKVSRHASTTSLPRNFNTGEELGTVIAKLGVHKSHNPWDKTLFMGFLSGVWVTFAGIFGISIAGGVPEHIRHEWPMIPKFLVGITFPVAIVFILIFGGELFTGNTMIMVVAKLNKKITYRDLIQSWALVFISNFASCLFLSYLFGYQSQLFAAEPYLSYVISITTKKTHIPFGRAILMGIPANALVCLSLFLGLASRDMTGKIYGLYLPVMTFAATGWEHCVANMFYMPLGYYYGAEMTVGSFLRNIAGVAIGNVIGGAVLIGI